MLKTEKFKYYRVKRGQSLRAIAEYFCVAERAIVKRNALTQPPFEGQILLIPETCGNVYTAREGDTPALLCGNEENFVRKNGSDILYIGMRVIL